MATTSDLKSGVIINFNNDLHSIIVSVENSTPGNLRAFYQVKMKNLNGKIIENRFRSEVSQFR